MNKIRKITVVLLLLVLLSAIFVVACKKTEKVEIVALKGPTAIGLIGLTKNTEKYSFSVVAMADEVVSKISAGQVDIAALPANVAAKVYNKTKGTDSEIKVLAINTLNVLYFIENSNKLNTINDLSNKTIYLIGKGNTPEYTLRYALQKAGVENCTLEFKQDPSEIMQLLLTQPDVIALMPEPFVSGAVIRTKDTEKKVSVRFSMQDVIGEDAGIVTGVFVARADYIKKNKQLIHDFIQDYERSVEYVNKAENIADVAQEIEKLGIVKEPIARLAVKNIDIRCISGNEMNNRINSYLTMMHSFDAKSIGGDIPDENFYYI